MIRLLGYTWSLPNTLLGLIAVLVYIPTSVRWSDGCLEVTTLWIAGDPSAQTWGWLIIYCHRNARADEDVRKHERVHVAQAFRWGVFYLVSYAAQWLWFLPQTPRPSDLPWWYPAYMRISFEVEAYSA